MYSTLKEFSGFDRPAPAEGAGLQEADRGCRGNCGSQPCKVSPNSINSGGRNTKGRHHRASCC